MTFPAICRKNSYMRRISPDSLLRLPLPIVPKRGSVPKVAKVPRRIVAALPLTFLLAIAIPVIRLSSPLLWLVLTVLASVRHSYIWILTTQKRTLSFFTIMTRKTLNDCFPAMANKEHFDELLALIEDLGLMRIGTPFSGDIPRFRCRPRFCDRYKAAMAEKSKMRSVLCRELYLCNRKLSRHVYASYHD